MGWQTLTVTASSGSKTVSVVSGSTANIKVGDALQVGAFSLCEITGVYAGQLTIKDNWSNATQTGASASVIPTFGDFNTAVSAINKLKLIINDNYQALNDWTTGDGEVTFTGLDGMTYTVKSASAMEAFVNGLEIGLDNRIVEAIAEVTLPEPDVYIPFNNSAQILRGFGPYDQIDVSAEQDGSRLVELPTRSVLFSRSSGRTVTKSGQVIDIGIDEPAIGDNGIEIFENYINLIPRSEFFEDTSPIGGTSSWDLESSISQFGLKFASPNISPVYSDFTITANSDLGYSVYVYRGESSARQTVRCESRGVDTRVMAVSVDWSSDTVNISTQNAGWRMEYEWINRDVVRVHLLYDAGIENLQNTSARVAVYLSSESSTAYYGGFQLVTMDKVLPYVRTNAASVASGADIVNAEINRNFPAPGRPFSVVIDVNLAMGQTAFWLGAAGSPSLYFERFGQNGKLRVVANQGHVVLGSEDNYKLDQKVRCIYSYGGDDNAASLFIDGDLIASGVTTTMIDYSKDNYQFQIGARNSGNQANGPLSEFKIYPFTINLELAKIMGAPK